MFEVSQRVQHTGGTFTFKGIVIGRFHTLAGVLMYAIEDERGLIKVFPEKKLIRHVAPPAISDVVSANDRHYP